MPRKKKLKIKLNDSDALENLMQEVYNDSCLQINDSQKIINELSNTIPAETIEDVSKVSREKSTALKIKESAIKIKLESGKLLSEIIKTNGDLKEASASYSSDGKVDMDDFDRVRELIKENAKNKGKEG